MKIVIRILLLLLDNFFVLRPVVIIPVWGFALFGYFKGRNGTIADLPIVWHQIGPSLFLWIVVFSISAGSVYVLNQIADIEIDKKNGGLPLLASGIVSPMNAWIMAIITAVVSIAIPAIFRHASITFLSAGTITIGIFYSFRPAFFSGRFLLDFISNAIGFGIIAFGCGWYLAGRLFFADYSFLFASFPYFLMMCAGSISSTIPDIRGDREGKKFTTAVVLGEKKAHLFAFVFVMAAAIYSLMAKDAIASICSISTLPFYLLFIISPKKVFVETTYKVGGALCMIAAGCIAPLFSVCALAVFLATWIYFRLRHGVTYPSFATAETYNPAKRENSKIS
jgi:4-hydroxybenzoate polyprenyltransferase